MATMLQARDDAKISERFASLLYQLRESRSLTQRAAARLIGISQTRLVSLERGLDLNTGRPTMPSPELTMRIAASYGYPREQLLLLAGYSPWLVDEDEAKRLVEVINTNF